MYLMTLGNYIWLVKRVRDKKQSRVRRWLSEVIIVGFQLRYLSPSLYSPLKDLLYNYWLYLMICCSISLQLRLLEKYCKLQVYLKNN